MTTEKITAPSVKKILDEHLQRHELKLDPKLHNVHTVIFGEKGRGGLCDEVEKLQADMELQTKTLSSSIASIDGRLKNIESGINKVVWTIILAVLGAGLGLIIIK